MVFNESVNDAARVIIRDALYMIDDVARYYVKVG